MEKENCNCGNKWDLCSVCSLPWEFHTGRMNPGGQFIQCPIRDIKDLKTIREKYQKLNKDNQ